jgi:hypothetical protein
MITQNEETGEWEKKTTGGDFLHVLNASEKDQLNQIHKVVDLLIRKSEKFFEWAPTNDIGLAREAAPSSWKDTLRLLPTKKVLREPSPFMDPTPVLNAPSIF